jgi:uncharacterized protein YfiM (DUF2279 family)
MDKVKHFSICLLFSVFGWYGVAMAIGLSFGKELGDKYNPLSKWDWWDLLADFAGIICGISLHYLIINL